MSLRNRRLSEFPNQAQISSYASGDRGPYAAAIPPVPSLPPQATSTTSRQPSNAGGGSRKPRGGGGAQPTYVKAAQKRGDAAAAAAAAASSGSMRRAGGGSGGAGGDDGRRKSRVGEKIKKRLSMRYAEGSTSSGAYPLEPMPPIPIPAAHHVREMRIAYADSPLDSYASPMTSSTSQAAAGNIFGGYSFPDASLDAGAVAATGTPSATGVRSRRPTAADARGLPLEATTQEDEVVKPRLHVQNGRSRDGEDMMDPYTTMTGGGVGSIGSRPGGRWDLEPLARDKVDVAEYLKQTLGGAAPDEVDDFKRALAVQKQSADEDLKRKVFANYAEFVTVAKEIATLENTMVDLKDLLNEWKTVPALLAGEVAGGGGSSSGLKGASIGGGGGGRDRKAARNSLLDLQNLYRTQLQDLWARISGSQKFLSLTPGRHLICEASNFVELNPATYKVKSNVELFLFDDLLLVASKRRKRSDEPPSSVVGRDTEHGGGAGDHQHSSGTSGASAASQSRLVAERCFNLTEVVVMDVKDSGGLTNALKIKRGKETFIFRTNIPEDKKGLLRAFRSVAEELAQKKRRDNEQEHERRKSVWTGDMMGRRDTMIGGVPDIPGLTSGPPSAGSAAETSAWIDSFEDDLTMAIAVREWDQACELVSRGRTYLKSPVAKALPNSSAATRLSTLTKELVRQLAYDLSNPHAQKSQIIKLVALLVKLDEAHVARDSVLGARRTLLRNRVQMIAFHGDIPVYVGELCIITFTMIKHTSDWYLAAFKDVQMASGLVTWARKEIETFAETFRRQVYGKSVEPKVVEDSLRVVAIHNRKLLRDAGLDLTFLLATLLQPNHDDPNVEPHPIIIESISYGRQPSLSSSASARYTESASGQSSRFGSFAEKGSPAVSDAVAPSPRPPPRSERRRAAPRNNDIYTSPPI